MNISKYKTIFFLLLFLWLPAKAEIYKCMSTNGITNYTSIPCTNGLKNEKGKWTTIEKKQYKEIEQVLKITKSRSTEEMISKPDSILTLAFIDAYRKCKIDNAEKEFLYKNRESFINDRTTAESKWKDFLNKDFTHHINKDYQSLSSENLKNRLKDCMLKQKQIYKKMEVFENNFMQKNPNFKGFNLEEKRPKVNMQGITLIESNTVNLPMYGSPGDLVRPGETVPKRKMIRRTIETKVVYLKNNEQGKHFQAIKDTLESINLNTSLCIRQGGDAMDCMCQEKINHKQLEDLHSNVLKERPNWEKVTFYTKNSEGVRSNRFPFGGVSLRLDYYNKYCK